MTSRSEIIAGLAAKGDAILPRTRPVGTRRLSPLAAGIAREVWPNGILLSADTADLEAIAAAALTVLRRDIGNAWELLPVQAPEMRGPLIDRIFQALSRYYAR